MTLMILVISQAAVFSNEFSPIANITTFNVDVSVSVNADVVAMFNYTCGNWTFDLGYNFWGRSCEKLKLNCECPQTNFAENTWVINGDASQFGCQPTLPNSTSRALSASESKATITSGTNFTTNPPFTVAQTAAGLGNASVDNNEDAGFGAPFNAQLFACSLGAGNNISTSIQPIFIKATDINFAGTQGISNKVFGHVGYDWECECWNPFFGIGFEAEFAQNNKRDNCNNNECDTDDVRISFGQAGVFRRIEPGVHAGKHGETPGGRNDKFGLVSKRCAVLLIRG